MSSSRFSRLDALLVLVIVAWGANLSVIKVALREFPAQSFNALRLIVAAIAFLGVLAVRAAPASGGSSPAPTWAASLAWRWSAARCTRCSSCRACPAPASPTPG